MESICREGRVIMRRQTRCLYLRDIQDMRVVDTFNYFFIEYQCKRETADNCMLLCSEVHACSMWGRAGWWEQVLQSGQSAWQYIQTQVRPVMVWSHRRKKDLGFAVGMLEPPMCQGKANNLPLCLAKALPLCYRRPFGGVWLHVPQFGLYIPVKPEHRRSADY